MHPLAKAYRIVFLFTLIVSGFGISQAQDILSRDQADSIYSLFLTGEKQDNESNLKILDKLIVHYRSERDHCREAVLLARRGSIKADNLMHEEGLSDIIQALRVGKKYTCDSETFAYIYLSYGNFSYNMNDQAKADSLARKGLNLTKGKWKDISIPIGLYMILSNGNKPVEVAIPFLDTALELAKKYNLPKLESKIFINMGATYADNGSYDLANQYFLEALELSKKTNNYSLIYLIYNNLAGVLAEKEGDHKDEILSLLDSAIHFARKSNDLISLQDYYLNKAYFLKQSGNSEDAYNYLWGAFELKDTILDVAKYEAIAMMEEKYEAEKRSNEIQSLKLENLNAEVENLRIKKSQNQLIIGSVVLIFVAGFLAYNFVVVRKNRNLLAHKNKLILHEQKRSDELLLNILPKTIAEDLKVNGFSKAQEFNQATILFTDFIEFTQASEKLETEELVDELNTYFMKFDTIVEKYGLEKIKTIGDSYMAAGGLPVPYDDTVKKTVLAALEMQDFVNARKEQYRAEGKVPFEMRAGIHTGSVVAGIVGQKKYQYDVWGDTVNTASRMENNGIAGKVNVSRTTYDLLKNDSEFTFDYRGKINAKGKGEIDMYFVSHIEKA